MKSYHIIPLLLLINFILSGCNKVDNEVGEDLFDLEWNKDIDIKENTMFYIDNDGLERTINIEDMRVILFPQDNRHYINIDLKDEILSFVWKDVMREIVPGIVQLNPYGLSFPEENFSTEYRGMLNIIEVSKGKWSKELSDYDYPDWAERDVSIKAIFHFKKEIYGKNNRTTAIDYKETKGIFYYSGVEVTGLFMGRADL